MGECYEGDNIDFDAAEWQYWVMKEDHFGMCDECGLVFFLASPEVLSQMELWKNLEEEWSDEEKLNTKQTTLAFDTKKVEELEAETQKATEHAHVEAGHSHAKH